MMGLASALPFIGFGFLDNFLMIVFGEFIDGTLCVYWNFSTMAAAAIGNTISDAAGIFSGGAVEEIAARLGVQEPTLTRAQRQLRETKVWQYLGQVIGILIGCTLGCCPLLWMDPEKGARLKKEKEELIIFQSVVDKVVELLHAEAAELMIVDRERGDLYSRNVTANLIDHRWRLSDGFMGHAAMTGKFVNVADVREEVYYDPELHENFLGTGIIVRSLLCMPVWHKNEVVGLINVINKQEGTFTTRDEDVLSAISTHVAVAMSSSSENFEEVLDNCKRSMTQQGAPQWNTATQQRRKTLFEPVLEGMTSLLGVESLSLLLLDEEHGELYTEAVQGALPKRRGRLADSFAGWTVERGLVYNRTIAPGQHFEEKKRLRAYDGSGVEIVSVLCVPIFDTRRKCLGAFEAINKLNEDAFDAEDVQYMQQVAGYIALMLEGPTAELRRVLALTRQRIQHKAAIENSGLQRENTVICYLERAQDLPDSAAGGDGMMDPYVTFQIVRGDPTQSEEPGLAHRVLMQRSQILRKHMWEIGKSKTIFMEKSPKWHETIAVPVPESIKEAPLSELYVHVLLWDYDSLHEDHLVAQAAFPLQRMPRAAARGARPFPLQPLTEQDGVYNLEKARIWLSFSRGTDAGAESAQGSAAAGGSEAEQDKQ